MSVVAVSVFEYAQNAGSLRLRLLLIDGAFLGKMSFQGRFPDFLVVG